MINMKRSGGFCHKRPGWPLNPALVSTHARGCSRQPGAPPASCSGARTAAVALKHGPERSCSSACSAFRSLQRRFKRTADRARVSLATVIDATVKFDPFAGCCSKSRAEQKRIRLQLRLLIPREKPHMTPPPTRSTDARGHFGTNNECSVIFNRLFCCAWE